MLLPFFQSPVLRLGAPLRWRLLGLRQPRRRAERREILSWIMQILFFFFDFPLFLFLFFRSSLLFLILLFFFVISLVRLLGYPYNGSTKDA